MTVNTAHLYALMAGEASGDTLGAGLMQALLTLDPKAQFIGIGGPKMRALGLQSQFKMEDIAVMGMAEVISHLIPIARIRYQLTKSLLAARPCVAVGIDAPDFNLGIEHKLRAAGIPSVHYVSPSIWAWRAGRLKKIKQACDEVLALLPFEKKYYDKAGIPCTYVGHRLAGVLPVEPDQKAARVRIALEQQCIGYPQPDARQTKTDPKTKVVAIMPGSRGKVIEQMLPVYAMAAQLIKQEMPNVVFIASAPNNDLAILMKDLWLEPHNPSLTIYINRADDVLDAADAALVTCGTIAFEAMLHLCPMAVCYRVSQLTAVLARRLIKIKHYSLPNLLSERPLVKEFIQDECLPENIAKEMLKLLSSDNLILKNDFKRLHQQLSRNSDQEAAKSVLRVAAKAPVSEPDQAENSAPQSEGNIEPSMTLPDEQPESADQRREPGFGRELR